MDEIEVAGGSFAVSGCQLSGAIEFVKASFNLVT